MLEVPTQTQRKRAPAVVALLTSIGLALASSACSSPSSSPPVKLGSSAKYASGWSSFAIAGPRLRPAAASDMKATLKGIPHATEAVAYYMTPGDQSPFAAKAALPAPPSEIVTVVHDPESAYLSRLIVSLVMHYQVTHLSVNGASGAQVIVPASSLSRPTDPKSDVGLLFLQRGTTLWEVVTVQSSSANASAVLKTFTPGA